MNGGAGAGMVDFFHGFQVALMMTVMLNLTQFVYWRCVQSRRGSCWNKYNPVLWTAISAIMVNVQPMMILIMGSWHLNCCPIAAIYGCDDPTSPSFSQSDKTICDEYQGTRTYPPFGNGKPRPCTGDGSWFWSSEYCYGQMLPTFPNKGFGWFIQVAFTWGGFVFMFVGILQATQLHRKFLNKWRAVRRSSAAARA
jgi:hypothetical protein